jgi:hypothetical protein
MVALLFLIGKKIEKPEIIINLLDKNNFNKIKPKFDMASENNLILFNCEFKNINWIYENNLKNLFFIENKIYNKWKYNLFNLIVLNNINNIFLNINIQNNNNNELIIKNDNNIKNDDNNNNNSDNNNNNNDNDNNKIVNNKKFYEIKANFENKTNKRKYIELNETFNNEKEKKKKL